MAPRTTGLGKINNLWQLLSVKQNLSPAWLLGPLTWGKLTTYDNFLSVKQDLNPTWLLEPLV